ncbi:ketoacyl-synt-domain-containing protein [Trametes elegans]|nr:ketoacyl-synt-domain-containing protein [Trametes elegans]
MTAPSPAEIAIVGVAAELPSGSWSDKNLDYGSFFRFLLERGEAYEKIPIERFNIHTLVGRGVGKCITTTGTFLKDVHLFDPLEFGVTNKDARMMPLSTRRLVETAFLSFLDSGIDYRGKNIGCYTSGVSLDMFSVSGHDDGEARGSFASCPSMIANRVSYHLDLRGPSIPIDTACSSSLTATHMAVQAIVNGECEAAVVGGSQIDHRFLEWLSYSQGGVLSPDGKCKPFDASANGFGRGEGVVCMVLKPLAAALRDGDKVYATILGTGINSCGSLAPISAPVASAQQEAMVRAFAQARRDPREVDFLELHATGTAMGDPTEANWVGKQFSRDGELLIGSVKGNIGHLEITAFLASLCKVCSIFETGTVPPNANFKTPNPAIRWKEFNFRVPLEAEPLTARAPSGRALVAMTSSGVGGSNGHCVVEAPPLVVPKYSAFWADGTAAPLLFVAGGLSPRSTSAVGADILDKASSWTHDVQTAAARAYGRRARSMTWRAFAIKQGDGLTKFSEPVLSLRTAPPIVFVFSGQGPQHYAMGRELFKTCAIFRDSILQLDDIYKTVTGQSLIERTGLFDGARTSDPLGEIWPIAITLVSLTMLQIALYDTLNALGIEPDVVVGHSAGETTLVYASGSGSRALAMELAIARGKAMSLLEAEKGTMAALSCAPYRAEEVIKEVVSELGPDALEVACYNAPGAITLAGHEEYVDLAVKKASDAGIFARRLRTRIPVHSSMMDICEEEYQRLVQDVFSRYRYWDNTRGPVRFTEAAQGIAEKHPHAIYVELGPHPVLTSYISSMAGKNSIVLCPLRRPRSSEKHAVEVATYLEALGKLIVSGYPRVDFNTLYGTAPAPAAALPPFPFARKDIPYTAPTAEIVRQRQHRNGPLNYPQLQLNEQTHPDLAQHVIKGEPILSTAGYVEMALEFGARKVYNVELVSILSLSAKRPTPVEVRLEGTRWSVLSAGQVDYTKTWPLKYNRLHAKGHLCMSSEARDVPQAQNVADIARRMKSIDVTGFYDGFRAFATYGPTYQRVLQCSYSKDSQSGNDEWLVKLRGADVDFPDIADYKIHPAILDASLHFLVHPVVTGVDDSSRYYLPSRLGAVVVHDALLSQAFPRTFYSHATLKTWAPETMIYDLVIMTETGIPLYSVGELEITMHGKNVSRVENRYEVVHQKTGDCVPDVSGGGSPAETSTTPDSGWTTPGSLSGSAASDKSLGAASVSKTFVRPPNDDAAGQFKIILRYRRGTEMEIRDVLKQLNSLLSVSLWLHASAGVDGDSLVGFARALRQEFLSWSVYAVVFDQSFSEDDATKILEAVSQRPQVEEDLLIEADGSISVPRIIEAIPPPAEAQLDPAMPWKHESFTRLVQTSTPYAPQDHVLVNVTAAAAAVDGAGVWSFVGRISSGKGPQLVAGVATGPLANIVVAHKYSLLDLTARSDSDPLPCALPAAIAALAVGLPSFSRPRYMNQKTILITHTDTLIGTQVAKIYEALGAQVVTLPSDHTVFQLKEVSTRNPQVIISGTKDDSEAQTFHDIVSRHGRVFLWNHPDSGIESIMRTDPCSVGDALRAALPYQTAPPLLSPPLELVGSTIPETVPLATNIIDPTKSYVLLGGINSFGLQLAYWLYQHGARELLLTSCSGRAGLTRNDDSAALRYLDYLEGLPDVRVGAIATGSSPRETLQGAVDRLRLPVGGCFVMSDLPLVNRAFVSQTQETFEAPFSAEVAAFKLAEQIVLVEKLDFLVTFSSVVGMFGNAGKINYASASTLLAGLTKKYRNAVCIVTPSIQDASTTKNESVGPSSAALLKHGSNPSMTTSEFLAYVEDAIRCVKSRPVGQYVPKLDWALLAEYAGKSPLFADLVPAAATLDTSDAKGDTMGKPAGTIKDVVCKVLEIAAEDLSADVPFTSYGLDSLSAAALSHALRPLVAISQLQLLADVNLRDVEEKMEAAQGHIE